MKEAFDGGLLRRFRKESNPLPTPEEGSGDNGPLDRSGILRAREEGAIPAAEGANHQILDRSGINRAREASIEKGETPKEPAELLDRSGIVRAREERREVEQEKIEQLKKGVVAALEKTEGDKKGPFTPEGVLDRNFGK